MERRDFLKALGLAGGLGALSGPGAAFGAGAGVSASAAGGVGAASEGDSGAALRALAETLLEIQARYLVPERGVASERDRIDGRRWSLHALQAALNMWLEADPERPVFQRYVSPTQKLLGDNPDAIYFSALLRPDRAYRVRGNLSGAAYTSLTVEGGNAEGRFPTRVAAEINDTRFGADANGDYEIVLSPDERPGNWLRLDPDAGTVTTRHYFEELEPVAADPHERVRIAIEPLDPPGPPPSPEDDATLAARIRRVANYLRAVSLDLPDPRESGLPPWMSGEPNRFGPPLLWDPASGGLGAVDNAYSSGPYALGLDEALEIRGRFPACRFANLVLWNRYMQTYDYLNRRVSLNRRQTRLEPDGSFRIVVAHRDPGVPNWIDASGRTSGQLFWRFQLPEEDIETPRARVVPLSELAAG